MTCVYWMLKMAWDLLLASWLWVAAVIRLAMPSSKRPMACLQSDTTCCDRSYERKTNRVEICLGNSKYSDCVMVLYQLKMFINRPNTHSVNSFM